MGTEILGHANSMLEQIFHVHQMCHLLNEASPSQTALSSAYNTTSLGPPDTSVYRKHATQSEWVQKNILGTKSQHFLNCNPLSELYLNMYNGATAPTTISWPCYYFSLA